MTWLARAFLWLLSLMPTGMPWWLSGRLAGLWMRLSPVKRHTTERNLQRCYPDMEPTERERLVRESFRHYVCSVFEAGRNWYWPVERLAPLCVEFVNEHLAWEALSSGRGMLVLAPHFGAWEYLGIYLQKLPDVAILYKPLSHAGLERVLQAKRGRGGAAMIPANARGLRALYAHLRAGKGVGVLPDQQPSTGQGRFAPFFGVPALTGVLVPRLVQQTGCIVLASVCERLPGGHYRVHFLPVDDAIHSKDLETALAATNRSVEQCIAIDPAQYLWSYRRFKTQPEGAGDFYA